MNAFLARFFGHPGVTLPLSLSLLTVASALVFTHAVTIRQVKEVGLPAAVELPQMERRLMLLRDQVEAAELQEVLGGGSAQEKLRAYVIPQSMDLERLLATFDILRDSLVRDGSLSSMSAIDVGAPADAGELKAVPVRFDAEVTKEGMDKLLLLLRLSGLLTVSDALSAQQLSSLINLTEEENPAALTVIEQFLSTDLLRYAREPASYEKQVLRSLTSPAFERQFRSILSQSLLAKARYLLGGELGGILTDHNLWPGQILSTRHVEVQPLDGGWYRVSLTLEAYVRGR